MVATDGQDVEPVTVDELRIGTAEVYDVIVTPGDAAYTIFAQSMDRSGYARGTLAPRAGMTAEVPALDARAILTMSDMGMSHAGMDHSQMDHSAWARCRAKVNHARRRIRTHRRHARRHAEHRSTIRASACATTAGACSPTRISRRSAARSTGAHAAREIELHLTGHMERYIWSFNGQKFSDAQPLRFTHNERLRIVLVNDTMMTHPIHLHGMWSELMDAHGEVPGAQTHGVGAARTAPGL